MAVESLIWLRRVEDGDGAVAQVPVVLSIRPRKVGECWQQEGVVKGVK